MNKYSLKKQMTVLFAGCAILVFFAGCSTSGGKLNTSKTPGVNEVLEAQIAEEESKKEAENKEIISSEGLETESEEASESGEEPDLPGTLTDGAPEPEEITSEVVLSTTEGIDVDLTILSSTMVYSQVYDMVSKPEDYEGKIIRMQGYVGSYEDTLTGNKYYGCIIQDATACCAQGIEFVLSDGQEYPADNEDVTVTGEFSTYEEDGFIYCTLKDARLEP